jgi:predicted RNA-binding protein (virulence factor B family)
MISIGKYNKLRILRDTSVGLFLGNEEGDDVLLPNKYVPEFFEIDDELNVFCYLDHSERLVATNLTPHIKLNEFALLQAVEVNDIGAFLDWGLEKHLFVPFKEQARKMEQGKWYLVYMYLDDETERLVGSSKTSRFLSNEELSVNEFDEVDLIVSRYTDLGLEVIINQKHIGLVYNNELFRDVHLGENLKGVIKKIREDNKIDVSLQALGYQNIEPSSEIILQELKAKNGYLNIHDKSDPEDIKKALKMSKKTFKKSIGSLYKQKLILIKEDGIYLV